MKTENSFKAKVLRNALAFIVCIGLYAVSVCCISYCHHPFSAVEFAVGHPYYLGHYKKVTA